MYASDVKIFHLLRKQKFMYVDYIYSKLNSIILNNLKFGFLCIRFYIFQCMYKKV